ncbi:vacuolar protein sorting/targeting protein 10 [Suhomyces tanzawaensis NRRL Y-17324]|uniref:Vacuolar protein sorting/targeting protein 10 n=1 Tax=Suhomyces tanzawaensis NRRL Y-17324 TaxID=984487 RepID=A0A1E4SF99_9ASCO|nr:vacuolar protein sorting/targeting protein 10 [Suhomyces tanzawaensis NRRL Y-17324]ODV78209.1 vacuolar protein sorting/targeting protein 10 [Suhomyces tanzawaensis NRRL Y-17324]
MRLTHFVGVVLATLAIATADYSPKVTMHTDSTVASDLRYFDDSPNILLLRDNKLLISFDDGKSFKPVKETKDNHVKSFEFNPIDNRVALAFTTKNEQYITTDQGKKWKKFKLPDYNSKLQVHSASVDFNGYLDDILLSFWFCNDHSAFDKTCEQKIYYSTDGLKSDPKKLGIDAAMCKYTKNVAHWATAKDNLIVCVHNKLNSFGHVVESVLRASSDYFQKSNDLLESGRAKSGKIIELRAEKNFIVAVVQNDKFNTKSKVSLLVSTKLYEFQEADLEIDFSYGVMIFLDSSPTSLVLAVMDYSRSMHEFSLSTMYASDSTGLKFTKRLENIEGNAIQKVQTIHGVWLANTAQPSDHEGEKDKSLLDLLIGGGLDRDVVSSYSFNDGIDWSPLTIIDDESCKVSDGCSLHLLSPTEEDGLGNYVTGPTPGILMAVGNKGKKLLTDLSKMTTWVSRDFGATWSSAIDEPCLFSFGDAGNIILAMPFVGKNEMSTLDYYFSLDQGKTWTKKSVEKKIFPTNLITTIDGSSQKFVVSGLFDKTPDVPMDDEFSDVMYSFDFSNAFDGKKCGDSDFEDVFARVVGNEKPLCYNGVSEKFSRRKQDARCFKSKLYFNPIPVEEKCTCSEVADFECAPEFKPSDKDKNVCVPDLKKINEICKTLKSSELKLKSIQKKVLNKCEGNVDIPEHKFKCSELLEEPGKPGNDDSVVPHEIKSSLFKFEHTIAQYAYMEEGEGFGPDNIVLITMDRRAYISNNGGTGFTKVPVADEITRFFVGLVPGQVVLMTNSDTIYVSVDAGNTFKRRHAPSPPRAGAIISFHKTDTDTFIWHGEDKSGVAAYITRDGGETFNLLKKKASFCEIVGPHLQDQNDENENMIFCTTVGDNQRGAWNLESSNNFFKDSKVVYEHIVGHAITGRFFVVATVDTLKYSLNAKVSLDGITFADADFPADLKVTSNYGYTVLGSESNAVFMHVTTSDKDGQEFGSLLKSNSNGTFYVTSLEQVNRDTRGYVDYDRIEGLEGVIISNTVVSEGGAKKLKTHITHNDGGEWNYLTPPTVDAKGDKYDCIGQPLSKCSLNLHGFTERPDYRDTFSSSSATGLMIGSGNVGEFLQKSENINTYMTRDGGITWREIRKGYYMWEYGDRGTIVVLVNGAEETDTMHYSLDEGRTWNDYKFAKEPLKVIELATVPSDTSKKFLIFGTRDKSTTLSYSIDFSGLYKRQCQLDLDNPDSDDFEYWTPSHPNLPDNCLFGHEARYLRRIESSTDCFIGSAPLGEGFKVIRNCTCSRRDYECDYNYFRDTDDTCKLVKGLSPSDRLEDFCKKENAFEYFEPTGYRKIPVSTCEGGKQFDKWNAIACPGKENEFNKHYGKEVSGGKLLAVFIVPLLVFFFATWFVYDRGIRRNGGFKRFGQIRLDDDEFQPIENDQIDKVVNKIVKGGIFVVAGLFATVKTVRKIDGVLFDKLTSAIFRRSPGRRNYVSVPDFDEEEELFGSFHDNYEDELEENSGLAQEFPDSNEPQDDLNEAAEDVDSADSRLFDIDDQSDNESPETANSANSN